jgi:hypothetical protein
MPKQNLLAKKPLKSAFMLIFDQIFGMARLLQILPTINIKTGGLVARFKRTYCPDDLSF